MPTPLNSLVQILSRSAVLAGSVLILSGLAGCMSGSSAGKSGPLSLADAGSFFVNGQSITTPFATARPGAEPAHIVVNQMYVQYRIPAQRGRGTYPIAMVPAGFHSGMEYETTPDGREGWSTYFLRAGYATYVVDHAGRARSGFDVSKFNQAKVQSNVALNPGVSSATEEQIWTQFRIGPAYGTPYPDTQFPLEAKEQYLAQLVPMTDGSTMNDTPKGLAALVDKIGPAIIIGHSMSGVLVLQAAEMRPDLVKAVVLLEASSCAIDPAKLKTVWARIPVLTIWGDHIDADPARGRQREQCQALVASINGAGGNAQLISLPAIGMKGNGHIMTVEKNNLQIAGLVEDWLSRLPR